MKDAVEIEERLIYEKNVPLNKLYDMIKILNNFEYYQKRDNLFENIFCDRQIISRVIKILHRKMVDNSFIDYNSIIDENQREYFKDCEHNMYLYNNIELNIDSDITNMYYLIICEELSACKDDEIRNKLVEEKYMLIFTSTNDEKDLAFNGLVPLKKACDTSRLISYYMGVNRQQYSDIKRVYVMKMGLKQIYKIIFLGISEDKIYVDLCLLRSILVMMSDSKLYDCYDIFMSVKNIDDKVKGMIEDTFLKCKNDREKPIKLILN